MCTLIVGTKLYFDSPLVVLANRDERLDRPTGPLRTWDRSPQVLAPEDLQAGGTWWGLSAAGLFVGITNRFSHDPDPTRRSRGLLVLDALVHPSARTAARTLAQLSPTQHNPFHLVLADRKEAHLLWSDAAEIHAQPLEPGWHVVTERSLDAAPTVRPMRVAKMLARLDEDRAPLLREMAPILAHHAEPSSEGTCVHAEDRNYGTRSATVLRLGRGEDVSLWHAEGRPCTTPFADFSPQARRLLRGSDD